MPAVANGAVVINSEDGHTYAYHANGTAPWVNNFCAGFGIESSAAISGNGLAIVGTICGVVAYNLNTGALVWSYSTDYVQFSPMIGPDGTVYYPTDRLAQSPTENSLLTAISGR